MALIQASTPDDDIFNGQFCGGVLSAQDIVLTAAHCVIGRQASEVDAVVEGDNLCGDRPIDGVRIPVTSIDIHPQYDAASGSFDLARLTLGRGVGSTSVRTLTDVPPDRTELVALGWGSASIGGVTSCRLLKVRLRAVDAAACAQQTGGTNHRFDPGAMVCAYPVDPQQDTCTGDSGGPLIEGDDIDRGRIVGIVSWGLGCGAGHPGVYALVRWP